MKYYTRLKQYKAGELIYDTENELATSHEWYWLAKRINGVMVVNDYRYSPTTARHAQLIKRLFRDSGIEYITIEAPKGLQNLLSAVELYESRISELYAAINKPRSRKSTNNERLTEIRRNVDRIKLVQQLMRAS